MTMRTPTRITLAIGLLGLAVGSFWLTASSENRHPIPKAVGSPPAAPVAHQAGLPSDQTTRPDPASRAADVPLETTPTQPSVPSPAAEEQIPPMATGKRTLGGPQFALSDLPPCRFARDVAALPAPAQIIAQRKLRGFTFPLADLNSLQTDATGGIFYACHFPAAAHVEFAAPVTPGTFNPGAAVLVSPFPTTLVFHSRPGLAKIVYLDFGGSLISHTNWPGEPAGGWNCKPFDVETPEDLAHFSINEQITIFRIWERVSQDYAPFDVDVTTQRPTAWTSTTAHALFTAGVDANGKDLPHKGSGGVAYVNVFGDADFSYNSSSLAYSPAWVAINPLNPNSLYPAEAAAHEIGHNLGLSHDGTDDGTTIHGYYGGHIIAAGDPHTWGPIMGGGTAPDLSQWSKGDYFDANNAEDDLAIIAGKLSYLADDAADSIAGAQDVPQRGNGTFTLDGMIGSATDRDVYRLTCAPGSITIDAGVYKLTSSDWGTDLDLILTLLDHSGAVLATNAPTNDPGAAITTTIPGTGNQVVYLQVSTSGIGAPLSNPPTGYTAYGSIGPYRLSATFVTPVGNPVITSLATFTVNEHQTAVTTITATSSGAPDFTLNGGLDAALFAIDAASGVLTFRTPPDFAQPMDFNRDQIYDVNVRVADGALSDTLALTVQVVNVDDPPVFTGATSVSVAENQTAVTTVHATDADGDVISYGISGGADAALFRLDSTSGVLVFRAPPDYESPADLTRTNHYQLTITARSGALATPRQTLLALAVAVTDVLEAPPPVVPSPPATPPTPPAASGGGGGGMCGTGGGLALVAGTLLGWRRRRNEPNGFR